MVDRFCSRVHKHTIQYPGYTVLTHTHTIFCALRCNTLCSRPHTPPLHCASGRLCLCLGLGCCLCLGIADDGLAAAAWGAQCPTGAPCCSGYSTACCSGSGSWLLTASCCSTPHIHSLLLILAGNATRGKARAKAKASKGKGKGSSALYGT